MNQRFGLDEKVISAIGKILKQYAGIEKAIIYGSRAKGNYRKGSDNFANLLISESRGIPFDVLNINLCTILLPRLLGESSPSKAIPRKCRPTELISMDAFSDHAFNICRPFGANVLNKISYEICGE